MSTLKVNKIENTATTDGGIAIDSTGHVQLDGVQLPTTGQLSGRRINHNGAMQIAQRGTSFTGVNATAYHCDRHELYFQNSSAAFTVTQATDTPDGFGASLKIDVTTADTSIASNEEIKLTHKIEGFDLQGTAKGTSAAEQLTLSFYVKATKTGTYVVELFDRDNTRDVSASYSVSDTNWNRYTLTFPADTGGSAFNNDNASSLEINWWLVAGSDVQGGSLNTAWRASSDGSSATGQVNFADSTDNDWLITGIQLEVGAKATPFEHRSFGDELARCQRYLQRISGGSNLRYAIGGNGSLSSCFPTTFLKQTMRASPTVNFSAVGDFKVEEIAGTSTATVTAISANSASTDTIALEVTSGGSSSANGAQLLGNSSDAFLEFIAEL
tara:strand:- start:764 stop:1915 length:1152 start_codon:yes stop_codon:yes gene_type:complete